MGSGLKESHIKIRKRVSLYSVLLVPSIIVGLALLAYQTYNVFTGNGFRNFDFEIGKLWKSDQPKIDAPISSGDLIIKLVAESQKLAEVRPSSMAMDLQQFPRIESARHTSIVQPVAVAQHALHDILQPIPLDRIDFIDIPMQISNPLLIKYVRQMDNEFLINPDLVGKKGKWYVGMSFAPSLNYRVFDYVSDDISGIYVNGNTRYTYGMTEAYRDQTDKAVSSYYTGIDIGYNINKRIDVSTGLYYSIYGETISVSRVENNDINAQSASFYDQMPLYTAPENSDKPTTIAYNNRFSYVEIPITLSVVVRDNERSDITVQAGIYGQMLDHSNALVYDFNTDYYYWMNRADFEIYRKYGLGISGGVMLSQFIGQTVEVFLNPQFKYNLTSTFKEPYPVNQRQYATGIRLGVRQHFSLK